MNFKSDNITGIHPQIMNALVEANQGVESSYGGDQYSLKLQRVLSEIFQAPTEVFLASTGTMSNSLALSSLVKPFEVIYCHENAHIHTDECNAPELLTGAKLVGIGGEHGKIDPSLLKASIESALSLRPHTGKPGCISLTQTTEVGTVYSLEELSRIKEIGHTYGLPIHMDGARFTNALVALGCTPAELTWKSGVDVLSFGATKNGAMAAEAIVFFNPQYAQHFDYRQKRAGQMMSKMRFFAAQFIAYFENDLWIQNAMHANKMAQNLEKIFHTFGFNVEHAVQANEVFVHLPFPLAEGLLQQGGGFYEWGAPGCHLYRFVTSCFTQQSELDALSECIKKLHKAFT